MQTRQEWMRDELIETGVTNLGIVGKFSNEKRTDTIADYIRSLLNFPALQKTTNIDLFFKKLKYNISNQNIMVMQDGVVNGNTQRSLSIKEVRAFVLIDDYAPLIFLNTQDSKPAKIFSLLHESVHILRGSEEVLSTEKQTWEERFINKVVEKVLMPKKEFENKFSLSGIEDTAHMFHVSVYAAGIRAKNLGLMQQKDLDEIIRNSHYMNKTEGKKSDGGNFYYTALSRTDPVFTNRVINSYNARKTSTTEAASLMGVSLKSFKKFIVKFQERYN
jgi:Zn-dependent peptidase ImmA (M78 family)